MMRALDLFCCAGGVSMGLHRAGFDVTGVDIRPQPRYPFRFVQADATNPPFDISQFDFIWASPPCQAHTALKTMHNSREHEDLIPQTRAMLQASGKPWVMENVPGAPMHRSALLCGTMFGLGSGGAELRRHRVFETSQLILTPPCQHASASVIGVYGGHLRNRRRATSGKEKGHADFALEHGHEAMGIDWMTLAELSQAIPPAYSEYLGRAILQSLEARHAAA